MEQQSSDASVSPALSSLSLGSDPSLDWPFGYKNSPDASVSPALSYLSLGSDQSLDWPFGFKYSPGASVSPARSSLSIASNQSLDWPFGFKNSDPGPGNKACDLCIKLRAVKFCVTCDVFYCYSHVRHHYTVKALQRHTLIDATEDMKIKQLKLPDLKTKEKDILIESFFDVLTAKNQTLVRFESELSYFTTYLYKGFKDANVSDFISDLVEVEALGRPIDIGMLYDCRKDFLCSDDFLWNNDTISSMKLSIPRLQSDERILEGDTLRDRIKALDLTVPLRASVVSGLVDVSGAAEFLKHPNQLPQQDRVTLHYKTSTNLDMLSHKLLQDIPPLPETGPTTATHVVVAVLYGAQAFCVFDRDCERNEDTELRDVVKKILTSSSKTELLSSVNDCTLYMDGNVQQNPVKSDSAVNLYRSLKNPLDPQHLPAVPLKAWLLPLKDLSSKSAHVREISEDQLVKAEKVLEYLKSYIEICQQPELSSFLLRFAVRRRLAACIQELREESEDGEKNLKDLIESHFLLQKIKL